MTGLHITEQQLHKKITDISLPGLFSCVIFMIGFSGIILSGFGRGYRLWSLCIAVSLAVILLTGYLVKSRWKEWSFLIITAVPLLILAVQVKNVKNGICILANEWLKFLTGKTGKIYLDFSVSGQSGKYLVPVLILAYISALLVWNTAHQRIWPGTIMILTGMLGCGCGFLEADVTVIVLVIGYAGLLLYRVSNHTQWRRQLAFIPGGVIVLAVGLLAAGGIGYVADQKVSSEDVKQKVTSKVHEQRYDHGESVLSDGNLVNLGAFKKSKETALKVTMDEPQKMYFRGMTADTYTGISWEALDTETYQKGEDLFYWLHKSGFYGQTIIGQATALSDEKQKPEKIKVKNISACSRYQYLPYALESSKGLDEKQIGDDRNLADSSQQEYSYYTGSVPQWYQTALWLSANQNKAEVEEYLKKEESYRKYVYKYDLQLTNTAVGVCEQLLGDETKEEEHSLSEILELIQTTLDEKLEYKTDTVTYNGKNDFFKYTIEQSKSGYSVQYATAATLLLRYLGVPARYVEGYYLSPQKAEQYEAGEQIKITKAQAHAWAEYYLDGAGWIPFEVTPGYIDEEENQQLTQILADGQGEGEGQTFQKSPLTYTPPKQQQESETRPDQVPNIRFRTKYIVSGILLLVLAFLLAVILWIICRRRKLLKFFKGLEESDRRTAITELYGYGQMLANRCQIEPDTENAAKMEQINSEARFSNHEMEEEKLQQMKQYIDEVITKAKSQRGFWKKFKEHYLLWLYR